MTFIRMNDGRDRGHVLDIPFEDAQAMLGRGQALPVDLSQPGALEFKLDPLEVVLHSAPPQLAGGSLKPKGDVVLAEPLAGALGGQERGPCEPCGAF